MAHPSHTGQAYYPNGEAMPAHAPLLALRDMLLGAARGAAKTAVTWPGDLEKLLAQASGGDAPTLGNLMPGGVQQRTLFPTGEDFDKYVPAAPNSQAGKGYKNDGASPWETLGQFAPISPGQVGKILPRFAHGGFVAAPELTSRLEARFNLPSGLLAAVMQPESGGDPEAVSNKGATGVMQLMPGTAKDLGVDPHDSTASLRGGAQYLGHLLERFKDLPTALAAWNWGPANVAKHGTAQLPPETQGFVAKVLQNLNGKEAEAPKADTRIAVTDEHSVENEEELANLILSLLTEDPENEEENAAAE